MYGSLIWVGQTSVILPTGCRASWFCHNHHKFTTHCHSDTTHCVIHKVFVYTVCFSVRIRGSSRNVPTGYITATSDREPICLWINLLSVDLMRCTVGKVTWNWAAKHLYSSVLDMYSETRQTSQVSSNLFKPRMTCVISGFQGWRCWLRLSVHL